jgi:hypothetical protein
VKTADSIAALVLLGSAAVFVVAVVLLIGLMLLAMLRR